MYSKTCLKPPHKKKTKIGCQDRLLLNTGQKYCRMLQGEHSAILSTFIKLPFVIKIFVLSIFKWPHKTDFTVPDIVLFVLYFAFRKLLTLHTMTMLYFSLIKGYINIWLLSHRKNTEP